jgi:hypothetical protein
MRATASFSFQTLPEWKYGCVMATLRSEQRRLEGFDRLAFPFTAAA